MNARLLGVFVSGAESERKERKAREEGEDTEADSQNIPEPVISGRRAGDDPRSVPKYGPFRSEASPIHSTGQAKAEKQLRRAETDTGQAKLRAGHSGGP